ncbi:MAG TPA: asparagine synthase (glutamine-hydrolyzing) [Bacteroidales bacterium]|nr:asparagine synthase (glutamine-hydrolyzing) [Bacteroidales bacterium]
MCGISGLYYINRSDFNEDEIRGQLRLMNDTLTHRGPDDNGLWMENDFGVGFGQTRLSIIDLTDSGHQPMVDPSTGSSISFNGEIFNYREIKNQYLASERFNSSSDTEVILKMYRKYGVESIEYLDGMFAFGLWDNVKKELILSRDYSGKKPLYYANLNGKFAFSSEIKALLKLPWIMRELDNEALYHFLTFSSLPEPYTMFKGISKFNPGHYMIINSSGIKEYKPFKELRLSKLNITSEKELSHDLISRIENAVQYRMVSDVPVGAFLSGGVDSSLMVAIMRENTNEEIKTYSIGFEEQPGYNELEYARRISKNYNTTHFERIVKPKDLTELLPKIVEIFDEPLSDTTSIPIYFISELAKQNDTKVIITGDGADELFAGYSNFKKYDKLYLFYNIWKNFPIVMRKSLTQLYGLISKSNPIYELLYRAENDQEFMWIGANGFKESTKQNLLSPGYYQATKDLNSYSIVQKYLDSFSASKTNDRNLDHIDWMCYMGYRLEDINRYLFRSDRLAMAHSVETRSPFLSKQLVDYSFSIPSNYKIRNGEAKYILKKAAEKYLSDEILYRKKQGFCVPIREWGGLLITDFILDNISNFEQDFNIFNSNEVRRQVKELQNGNKNYTNNIWTIYLLINWFNKWMK